MSKKDQKNQAETDAVTTDQNTPTPNPFPDERVGETPDETMGDEFTATVETTEGPEEPEEVDGTLFMERGAVKDDFEADAEALQTSEESRQLKYVFTEDEINEMSVSAVRDRGEADLLKAKLKIIMSKVKSYEERVNLGYEYRDIDVECRWNNPTVGHVKIVRLDNYEVIENRPMSHWEKSQYPATLFDRINDVLGEM